MCMRSGLVIKTAPSIRSTASRCQTEGPQRNQGPLGASGATYQQQCQQQYGDGWTSDAAESNASNPGSKTTLRSTTLRHRSVDYLSIVTRFYMMQRIRDSDIEILPVTQSPENEYRYWLDIEQCFDDCGRSVGLHHYFMVRPPRLLCLLFLDYTTILLSQLQLYFYRHWLDWWIMSKFLPPHAELCI